MLSLLITGIGHQSIILGLPWLISEDPDINWKAGMLQWRPTALTIIEDNDDNEGGIFTSNHPPTPYEPRNGNFVNSLMETFMDNNASTDISCLDILKI
jgi:hypothetical protein